MADGPCEGVRGRDADAEEGSEAGEPHAGGEDPSRLSRLIESRGGDVEGEGAEEWEGGGDPSRLSRLMDREDCTEEELQAYMEVHSDILNAADGTEPLATAGEHLTDSFADSPKLYSELLRLCMGVVDANGSREKLEDVARQAMERAALQRVLSPETGHRGAFAEMFAGEADEAGVRDSRQGTSSSESENLPVGKVVQRPQDSATQGQLQQARPVQKPARQLRSVRRPQGEGGNLLSNFMSIIGSSPARRQGQQAQEGRGRRPLVADGELAARLQAMGFSKEQSEAALVECGNDVTRAVQRLTAVRVDDSLASQLKSLGFSDSHVHKALLKTNNDPASALEMLTAGNVDQDEEDAGFQLVDASDAVS